MQVRSGAAAVPPRAAVERPCAGLEENVCRLRQVSRAYRPPRLCQCGAREGACHGVSRAAFVEAYQGRHSLGIWHSASGRRHLSTKADKGRRVKGRKAYQGKSQHSVSATACRPACRLGQVAHAQLRHAGNSAYTAFSAIPCDAYKRGACTAEHTSMAYAAYRRKKKIIGTTYRRKERHTGQHAAA